MLILGGRYGSVDTKTSLSYTELEYDYAISTSKPIFAVVITEAAIEAKVKIDGMEAVETDCSKELKFFREKVLSRTSSFFSDTKDIKLAVHETMADYAKRLDFTGWVSGKDVVDTKPLLEEISRLRDEKDGLQAKLNLAAKVAARNSSTSATKWPEGELSEIAEILQRIEVSTKVYTADQSKPAVSLSVLKLLSVLRDDLITGVSNRYDSPKDETFLYYNVCPKLEIYELAALEKVAGVQWQRYKLTSKGKAFLAFLDRNEIGQASAAPKTSDDGKKKPAIKPATPKKGKSVT